MAVRTGMAALILRLRALTETGATDYVVGATTYWVDQQLQDILDSHMTRVDYAELVGSPEYAAGATIWKDYETGYKDLEEVASGSPYWSLVDSTLTEVSTGAYTLDPISGVIRFAANTSGAVYWLKARSYSLTGAAAEVWRAKASHAASLYDFTTEGQSFKRSQWYDHAVAMAEKFERQDGMTFVPMYRSDLL